MNPKLSEEHVYPRKVAARLLIENPALDGATLAKLFSEQFGRVHLITPEENKAVQQFQRANVFTSPDNAYAKAGITFIKLSDEELRSVKRRSLEMINAILARSGMA